MNRITIAISSVGLASAQNCDLTILVTGGSQATALLQGQAAYVTASQSGVLQPQETGCDGTSNLQDGTTCTLACGQDQEMLFYNAAATAGGDNPVVSGTNEGYSTMTIACAAGKLTLTATQDTAIWNGGVLSQQLPDNMTDGSGGSVACVPRTCNQPTEAFVNTQGTNCKGTENTTSSAIAECTANCATNLSNDGVNTIGMQCVVDATQTSNTGGNGAGLGLKWQAKTTGQMCAVECQLGLIGTAANARIIQAAAWSTTTGVKEPTGTCNTSANGFLRKGDSCEMACNQASDMLFYDSAAVKEGTTVIASGTNEGFVKSTITCVEESNAGVVKMTTEKADMMWGGSVVTATMTIGVAGGAGSLACLPRTCNNQAANFLGTAKTQTPTCAGTAAPNTCDQKCITGAMNGNASTIMLKCVDDATQTSQTGGNGAGLGLKWEANTNGEQCKADCNLSLIGATADSRLITEETWSTTTGVKEPTDATCTKTGLLTTGSECSLACNSSDDMLFYDAQAAADGTATISSGKNEGFVASKVRCEFTNDVATIMLVTDKASMMWGGDAISGSPAKGAKGGAGSIACVKRTCNSPTTTYLNTSGTSCKGTQQGQKCEDSCQDNFTNNGNSKISIDCKVDATSTTANGGNGAGLGVAWSPTTAGQKCNAEDNNNSASLSIATVAFLVLYGTA